MMRYSEISRLDLSCFFPEMQFYGETCPFHETAAKKTCRSIHHFVAAENCVPSKEMAWSGNSALIAKGSWLSKVY